MRKYTYFESMITPPKYIHRINKTIMEDKTHEHNQKYIDILDVTQVIIEFNSSLGQGELQRGQLNERTS